MDYEARYQEYLTEIESYLGGLFLSSAPYHELQEAMRYSLLSGGKRIRPVLTTAFAQLFGGDWHTAVPLGCALELVHTYSLIHDDLPCMDDDMMRRGKASTWAEYGEDIGVLAGDALMMYAVETAAKAFEAAQDGDELARVGRAMGILARKTGVYGMIGGQTVDVELAGGPIPKDKLDFIYRLKTGALIEASMLIGAVLGGAADQDCRIVESLASKLGLAFQIQDDILDVAGDAAATGKPAGSDARNKKTTYVTLEGLDKAKKEVERLSREAAEDLDKLGSNEFLESLIQYLAGREK